MFCPKCGSEVQEGAAFCGKCGAPVGSTTQVPVGNASDDIALSVEPPKPEPKRILKVAIGIVVAIAAIIVLVGVAVSAISSGGNEGVVPGTYRLEQGDRYMELVVGNGNEVAFKSDGRGLTGSYEKVNVVDGSLVFRAQNLKREDGVAASIEDVRSIFGGYFGDSSLEAIYFCVPEGYDKGNVEGVWGVVCAVSISGHEGVMGVAGNAARVAADGTGEFGSVYDTGDPSEVLAGTRMEDPYALQWRKTGASSYGLTIDGYGSDSFSFSMPVEVAAIEPTGSPEGTLQEEQTAEGEGEGVSLESESKGSSDGRQSETSFNANFQGDWVLMHEVFEDGSFATQDMLRSLDDEISYTYLQFKEDGSVSFKLLGGEPVNGTWETRDAATAVLVFSDGGNTLSLEANLEGALLSVQYGSSLFEFNKGSIPADALSQ